MKLAIAREILKMTQWQFGRWVGISKTTIWRLENGDKISAKTCRTIARALEGSAQAKEEGINVRQIDELAFLFPKEEGDAPRQQRQEGT